MKKIFLLVAVLCLPLCTSMRTDISGRIPNEQMILCGDEYKGGWGYFHWARYISSNGNVYRVKYVLADSIWTIATDGSYSKKEFQRLLKKATKCSRKVQVDTLKVIQELIKLAREGNYSERVRRVWDAGQHTSFAFFYDTTLHCFKKFILKDEGDSEYKNTSKDAQQLDQLLRDIFKDDHCK